MARRGRRSFEIIQAIAQRAERWLIEAAIGRDVAGLGISD
jgi:hypothetical protein